MNKFFRKFFIGLAKTLLVFAVIVIASIGIMSLLERIIEIDEVTVIDCKPAFVSGKWDGYALLVCSSKGGETFRMLRRNKENIGAKIHLPTKQAENLQHEAREERLNGVMSFTNKDNNCKQRGERE